MRSGRSDKAFWVRGVVIVIAPSDGRCIASANKPTVRDVDDIMPLQSVSLLWVPGDGGATTRLDHVDRVWGSVATANIRVPRGVRCVNNTRWTTTKTYGLHVDHVETVSVRSGRTLLGRRGDLNPMTMN
ncbi:hypothetical protein THAOC_17649 [Thalassiosira oceanica]|uniref:Uncharacterized protein n=1 Tax=Thalassiosira oceanica TaxID=159749 RepID=K0S6U2_THAOC|nr:hypothetical protein THAOC_17649 [Thalassiosira oceanica]|eukprot:EJK61798.1 hypothetical protein THAOC_17649 [Thalassiosira oceanica]